MDPASPTPALSRWEALLAAALPPLLLLGLCLCLLRAQGYFLVDDAYISFRYSANLAAGHGLVWNPGERVEGYTNLLWVLLLAPFAWLGWDLVLPAVVLSGLSAAGCLELLRRVTRRALPHRRPIVSGLPGLLLVANPSFCYWAAGGMEGPLFAFLCLLAVHLLQTLELRSPTLLSGAALGAACLTRPEGAAVAAVVLGLEVSRRDGPLVSRLRRVLLPALMVVAVVGAQLSFRLLYYGFPLPNTFYAKVIPGWVALYRGVTHLGRFMLAGGVAVLPGLLALRWRGPARPYLIQGYVLLGAYLLYLLIIGGDLPYWFRFYVPLLPLPLLGLAEVLCRLGERLHRAARPRSALLAGVPLAVVAALAPLAWQRSEARWGQIIHAAGASTRAFIQVFLRPTVPESSVLAASAVGLLGYYTRYRIIDAWGLNDAYIAHLPREANPSGRFAHDKEDWFYVLSRLPDYLIVFQQRLPPVIPGYDLCWPSLMVPELAVHRRNFPLPPGLSGLGVPPGAQRELLLPPPCPLLPPVPLSPQPAKQ